MRQMEMKIIYVGDSRDVVKRILTNHCKGNVEASVLRKHVAEAMGYTFRRTKRPSGSIRVRIVLPNPKVGEDRVSDYICTGKWKYVICKSYGEAHDFQWYVIDRLNPVINKERRTWDFRNIKRYEQLLSQLINCPVLDWWQLQNKRSGPGVYILLHRKLPEER